MNIKDFAARLKMVAPSRSDLENCGLTVGKVDEFIKSFIGFEVFPFFSNKINENIFDDIQNWNLSQIQIGIITFIYPFRNKNEYIWLGNVEVDLLMILKKTEEVLVCDVVDKSRVLWLVANSIFSMFDAFAIAAQFLADRAVGKIDFDDFEAINAVAAQCAVAAGGERFIDFYRMLLG